MEIQPLSRIFLSHASPPAPRKTGLSGLASHETMEAGNSPQCALSSPRIAHSRDSERIRGQVLIGSLSRKEIRAEENGRMNVPVTLPCVPASPRVRYLRPVRGGSSIG